MSMPSILLRMKEPAMRTDAGKSVCGICFRWEGYLVSPPVCAHRVARKCGSAHDRRCPAINDRVSRLRQTMLASDCSVVF
jgi:hypothetical protein